MAAKTEEVRDRERERGRGRGRGRGKLLTQMCGGFGPVGRVLLGHPLNGPQLAMHGLGPGEE